MRRSWAFLLCVQGAGLVVASTPTSASVELARFEGSWVRTRVDQDDAAREAEILRVTATMPFLARSFARALMSMRMRPANRIWLACEGDDLLVDSKREGDGTSGRAIRVEPRADGTLEETWSRGSDAHGTTIWELSRDAKELFLRIRAFNPSYRGALRYTTTYRRDAAREEPARRRCGVPAE